MERRRGLDIALDNAAPIRNKGVVIDIMLSATKSRTINDVAITAATLLRIHN